MPARALLRLTLVRHAKTEPGRPGQEDWDRVLEPRGQRDAPEMARRVKQLSPKIDRILSSPAVRAITTATIMTRELGVSAQKVQQDERLYLASPKDMLAVIRELGEKARHLMVVDHNPGITEFADRLLALEDTRRAGVIYELLLPYADRVAVSYAENITGSVARYLGLLAATMGRGDVSAGHFEDALAVNERIGARPWLAHAREDYGRLLLARDGPGDREKAEPLLSLALADYDELGIRGFPTP